MKQFLIKYRVKDGLDARRRDEILAFIAAVDGDPDLRGRITYRCMKVRDSSDYYHFVTAADDDAVKTLQSREFFSRYTDQTDAAAQGEVEVLPLELVADTAGPRQASQ
jgi:hypothetical protein